MSTVFPGSLDTFRPPQPTETFDTPGAELDVLITNLQDALRALQAKVGVNNSTVSTSLDARITALGSGSSGGAALPFIDVTQAPYNAVRSTWVSDGVADTDTSTIADNNVRFRSATANFSAADVNKNIFILGAGDSSQQAYHGKITTFVSDTEVIVSPALGRSKTDCYAAWGTDQTTALQTAINDAEVFKRNGIGAGLVFIPAGYFWHTGLTQRNGTTIEGAGMHATWLGLIANSNRPCIRSEWISGTFAASFTKLRYLTIDGNRKRQTLAGSGQDACHGVQHWSISGVQNPRDFDFDTHHELNHVFIFNTKGCGYISQGRSEIRLIEVQTKYTDEYGLWPSYDTNLVNCITSYAGRAGRRFSNSSIRDIGGKSWFNGGSVSGEGHGWHIENISRGTITISGGEAQDNKGAGLYISGCDSLNIQLSLDSNNNQLGTGGQGLLAGLELVNSRNNILTIAAVDRFQYTQASAVKLTGTCTKNKINIVHDVATAPTAKTITAMTGASVTVQVTIVAHGYQTGNMVRIAGVGGNTAANGVFHVTRVSADAFTLQHLDTRANIVGNAAYTSGGTATLLCNPIHLGSTSIAGNEIIINNQIGHQSVAFAGTTLTPRVYDGGTHEVATPLTAATAYTIAPPAPDSRGHEGCQLMIMLTMPTTATTVPTLTWDAVYKVGAGGGLPALGKTRCYMFMNVDGVNWRLLYQPIDV